MLRLNQSLFSLLVVVFVSQFNSIGASCTSGVNVALPLYAIPTNVPHAPCIPNQPTGIYTLSFLNNSTYVDGLAYRTTWKDIETSSKGVYDFSALDLQFNKVVAANQSFSLDLALPGDPPYLLTELGVGNCTYTFIGQSTSTTRLCPWDPVIQSRFAIFVDALASHQVLLLPSGSQMVALKDHPALKVVQLGVPGLGALRLSQVNDKNIQTLFPGYTRSLFATAVVEGLKIGTSAFSKQSHTIGFWSLTDNVASPALWFDLVTSLSTNYTGLGPVAPFMDNLAAAPRPRRTARPK